MQSFLLPALAAQHPPLFGTQRLPLLLAQEPPPTHPPPPIDNGGGCKLLDNFAIAVQVSLATSALLTLVYKRWRERPQRPVSIWALDVSKQFIGAAVIHFLNLLASYFSGNPHKGPRTNLCVWYFLNVAVDTTIGVGILWLWLHALQWILQRLFHVKHLQSGAYGPPPLRRRMLPWIRQTIVFCVAESLMKLCVVGIFRLFPFLYDIGKWVLHWTRDNYRHQVVFVMFIFPLIMNAIQFWVVDTIVKLNPQLNRQVPHTAVGDGTESSDEPSSDDVEAHRVSRDAEHTGLSDEQTPLLQQAKQHHPYQ